MVWFISHLTLSLDCVISQIVVVVYIDGVRLYLRIEVTNGPFVRRQMIYEYGEPWWNDIDRGKLKNSEKSLCQCHFVHHKSNVD
jgi:hypothetical protein